MIVPFGDAPVPRTSPATDHPPALPGAGVLDGLPEPAVLVSAEGKIVAANRLWCQAIEVGGGDPAACGPGADYLQVCDRAAGEGDTSAQEFASGLRAVLAGASATYVQDYPCPTPAESRWFRAHVGRAGHGRAVITHTEITDLMRTRRALDEHDYRDAVTGLPSHEAVTEYLDALWSNPGQRGAIWVAELDIDRLRALNASLGLGAGNELLRLAAARVRSECRAEAMVARSTGDGFLIVGTAPAETMRRLIRRLLAAFTQPFQVGTHPVLVTVGIGAAHTRDDTTGPSGLLAAANTALDEAKRRGRGRYVLSSPALRNQAHAQVQIASDLARAMTAGDLDLHYQPILRLQDGALHGLEALLRWNDPRRGPVSPAVFIPVAEASGQIIQLGRWVIKNACAQAARWLAAGTPVNVGINLSGAQLADPGLVALVARQLDKHAIPPHLLVFEVTETAVLHDARPAIRRLQALHRLGVGLSLDDFGTGYSSLSHLRRLPIRSIKIDRSFITGLTPTTTGEGPDTAIVSAITTLAHTLGLAVVAEGVETAQQLHIARQLGCDFAQGFHLQPPVPAHDIRL